MARFRIIAGGSSRAYDILDDDLRVGASRDNSIVVAAEGVAATHARVWREADGLWIGPVDGAPLHVAGLPVARHRLRHGDRVQLAPGCALEYLDPQAPREVRPATPAAAAKAAAKVAPDTLVVPSVAREAKQRVNKRERRQKAQLGQGPRWHLFSGIVLVVVVVGWILVRVASGTVGVKSAEDLLTLAETQLVRGNPDLAKQTAQTAASRASSNSEVGKRIQAFLGRLEQTRQAAADEPLLELARQALENLRRFESNYLAATPTARPAARDFVRLADQWRERYATVSERYELSRSLPTEVAAMRSRYVAAAQLEQPDNAADVMFAATRATKLRRPRYREAIGRLDAYLQSGAADAGAVRGLRDTLASEGKVWVERRLERYTQEAERGRVDDVRAELDLMVEEVILDEWRADFESTLRRLRQ